ncbi:MAG: response regulator [Candidatus Lokiarchaeota archaeon]|nr:response regulator [Candidatus Lokiarchaeota archaeon]MBD3342675.1 response regulator [Candidatus Lokiarchaeota archaeon]
MFKILIADDDRAVLRLYKLILKQLGLENLEFAKSGKEAIEKYKKNHESIKLTLLDYRMPLINGLEVMYEILKINRNAIIIFASADASVKEIAISSGARAFLNKPFDIHELLDIIKNVIDFDLNSVYSIN